MPEPVPADATGQAEDLSDPWPDLSATGAAGSTALSTKAGTIPPRTAFEPTGTRNGSEAMISYMWDDQAEALARRYVDRNLRLAYDLSQPSVAPEASDDKFDKLLHQIRKRQAGSQRKS